MIIRCISENTSCRRDLKAEHGLSLYIETGEHRILFDGGQSPVFWENAEKMGIDLTKVDTAVLSHGHYDHGGGMVTFLERNHMANLYVSRLAFGEYYNGTEKYIGLPAALKNSDRIIKVGENYSISQGITILNSNSLEPIRKIESYGLNVREQGTWRPDLFCHEQYLMIEENGKRILFSGCSHRGILNIQHWFTPDILVGGFHFKKLDVRADQAVLQDAAVRLMEGSTRYYTCHCTGVEQYEYLKTIMGDRLKYLSCGTTITI